MDTPLKPEPAKTTAFPRYVILTAAKNEAVHIEKTIDSVARQTVRPEQWVIVDDGSTDATGDIIRQAGRNLPFITLIVNAEKRSRDFGAKATVLRKAFEALAKRSFDYIGNLDADVSFSSDFYTTLIERCEKEPRLGITGGVIWEQGGGEWRYSFSRPSWCVGGATHFFRRPCFEQIGSGYPVLRYGGEDTVVEYLAREHGWEVRAMTDLPVYHHKPSVSPGRVSWRQSYHMGIQEHHWGTSLCFELLKCAARTVRKPYIVGGIARLAGFMSQRLRLVKPDASREIIRIVRRQQWQRVFGKHRTAALPGDAADRARAGAE
ncbi:MAG: glycosyltransferase family 2 protein [Chitinispirillaceae bacterium]|nr:glycosyltransferase family 2 protein [Chitinispirillaceae bacterium]